MNEQAGPELDALVAEKVMGWARREWRKVELWNPSEHIADAWLAVEKMIEMGYYMDLYTIENPSGFKCHFVLYKVPPYSEATTAPLAISLAALKCVDGGK